MSILFFLKPQYRRPAVKETHPLVREKKKKIKKTPPAFVLPPPVTENMDIPALKATRRRYEEAVLHMMTQGYL